MADIRREFALPLPLSGVGAENPEPEAMAEESIELEPGLGMAAADEQSMPPERVRFTAPMAIRPEGSNFLLLGWSR